MDEHTRDTLVALVPDKKPRIRAEDLQGIDLKGHDISRLDFSDTDMSNSDLSDCQARAALFVRCSMRGANMKGMIAEGAQFVDCDLTKADVRNTKFNGAWFTRARMDSMNAGCASFVRASIVGGSLRGCTLSKTHWTDAHIRAVNMMTSEERRQEFLGGLVCLDHETDLDWGVCSPRYYGYRAVSLDEKSLMGLRNELGQVITVGRDSVSLDERDGCAPGLAVCATAATAHDFGRAHFHDGYIVHEVIFSASKLCVVHLSGDFGRVCDYSVHKKIATERG